MAENLQIHTTTEHITALLSGRITYQQFLTDMFSIPANHSQMCIALREYHRNDGGSPEVHDFELQNFKLDTEHAKGRFRCRFEVLYHFTCSDVRNKAFDTIDWEMVIDRENAILKLTGEEILTPE
jgi:hypothetical protein